MKHFLIIAASLMLLVFTAAFAAVKTVVPPSPSRVPEMSTAGKVIEITATSMRIERTLKGEAEIMEFMLKEPFTNIAVGDQIKVSYLAKDGRNVLTRVAPAKMTAMQKPKQEASKAAKPAEPKAEPVAK